MAKSERWIELSDSQIAIIEEALQRDLPYYSGMETLRKLIQNCKQIKVR